MGSDKELLRNAIEAFGKSLDEPSPENDDAAYKLLEELKEMWSKSQPFDWDTYNQVSEWLDRLESGNVAAPSTLLQKAIAAGERYMNDPNDETKVQVVLFVNRISEFETATMTKEVAAFQEMKIIWHSWSTPRASKREIYPTLESNVDNLGTTSDKSIRDTSHSTPENSPIAV